jgi:hypothetical protein
MVDSRSFLAARDSYYVRQWLRSRLRGHPRRDDSDDQRSSNVSQTLGLLKPPMSTVIIVTPDRFAYIEHWLAIFVTLQIERAQDHSVE